MICKKCGTDMGENEICPGCGRKKKDSYKNKKKISYISWLLVGGAVVILFIGVYFLFRGNTPQKEADNEGTVQQSFVTGETEKTEQDNKELSENGGQGGTELPEKEPNTDSEKESNTELENEQKKASEIEQENENVLSETSAENVSVFEPMMEAYRNYLNTLDSVYTYFTLKDVTGDGAFELIYYETDVSGFMKKYTVMKYADGQLEDIMHGESYGYQNMILGNDNCLMLFLSGSDYDTTYFYIFSEESVETVATHAEYVYGMYDLEETFYFNGEVCESEALYEKYMYFGIDYEDLIDAYGKYPEDRFIQSAEPLNFYVNSEQEKERVFGESLSISPADEESFNILLGILDYARLYGGYFEEGASVQDWSDEIKLSILDYYIGTYCLEEKMSGMAVDEYSYVAAGLEADFHNNAYYAVKLSEVNRILEGLFPTGLKSTPSTSCAIYHNGYYFFLLADFGNFMPTSVIESIEPKENCAGTFIIKAKCGQEIFEDDGSLQFVPNDGEGRTQTFVVKKDVQALVSGVRILEWNY